MGFEITASPFPPLPPLQFGLGVTYNSPYLYIAWDPGTEYKKLLYSSVRVSGWVQTDRSEKWIENGRKEFNRELWKFFTYKEIIIKKRQV